MGCDFAENTRSAPAECLGVFRNKVPRIQVYLGTNPALPEAKVGKDQLNLSAPV